MKEKGKFMCLSGLSMDTVYPTLRNFLLLLLLHFPFSSTFSPPRCFFSSWAGNILHLLPVVVHLQLVQRVLRGDTQRYTRMQMRISPFSFRFPFVFHILFLSWTVAFVHQIWWWSGHAASLRYTVHANNLEFKTDIRACFSSSLCFSKKRHLVELFCCVITESPCCCWAHAHCQSSTASPRAVNYLKHNEGQQLYACQPNPL